MYIFLDVDGVLNTSSDWSTRVYSLNTKCTSTFCTLIRQLKNPQIVLSSTWRNGIARDGSTAAHIDDLMAALKQAGITSIDKTMNAPDGMRSKEIDYYLRRHDPDKYIILDDDMSLFELKDKTPHLYLTNPNTGLTEKDIKKILKKI